MNEEKKKYDRQKMISFRADVIVLKALNKLVAKSGSDTFRNRRSSVIRRAILELADRED